MKTVLETLQGGAGYLEKRGVESARLQMEHLLAHVLGCERLQLYLDFDRPLAEGELGPLRELVRRRAAGEPLQHLLGTVEFHGREFKCDGRALIPRPETEELVEKMLARGAAPGARVLDMGAGSGVIGLTLACELDAPEVTLADISAEALVLARENAEKLAVPPERLVFAESDLFAALDGAFDVIVANLPYVPRAELAEVSREVHHDPATALAGGESGMEIMMRFILESAGYMADGGRIAMEVGAGQATELLGALEEAGYVEVEILADYAGIERFLFARKA